MRTRAGTEFATKWTPARCESRRQLNASSRSANAFNVSSPGRRPKLAEVGIYLGGLGRLRGEGGWVEDFELEVEKPLLCPKDQIHHGIYDTVLIISKLRRERYQEPRFAQPGGSVRASPPSLKDLGCRLDLGARGLALRTVTHQGCRSRYALIAEKTATTRSGVRRFFLLPPRFPANHTLSVDLQSATCFKFPLRKLFRASGMHLPAAISQVRVTTLGISEKRWNGSSQCRGERGGG